MCIWCKAVASDNRSIPDTFHPSFCRIHAAIWQEYTALGQAYHLGTLTADQYRVAKNMIGIRGSMATPHHNLAVEEDERAIAKCLLRRYAGRGQPTYSTRWDVTRFWFRGDWQYWVYPHNAHASTAHKGTSLRVIAQIAQ